MTGVLRCGLSKEICHNYVAMFYIFLSVDARNRSRTHTVYIISGPVTRSFRRFLSRKFPVYRRLLLFLITIEIQI